MRTTTALLIPIVLLAGATVRPAVGAATADEPDLQAAAAVADLDPTLGTLRGMIDRFAADRGNLRRFHDAPGSVAALERRAVFHQSWLAALQNVDFDDLDQDGRVDYVLFRNLLEFELREVQHTRRDLDETASLIPFAGRLVALHEARRANTGVEPEHVAQQLDDLAGLVEETRGEFGDAGPREDGQDDDPDAGADETPPGVKPAVANRAARTVDALRGSLGEWFRFYDGYDPLFSWWVAEPYGRLDESLEEYAAFLRRRLVGIAEGDEDDAIIGDPIGRDALMSRLAFEMIPYTPEELIAIADREYAWCLAEMLRAADELGFGDDWQAALDHVKSLHVGPGEQPALIDELAREAIKFIEQRDLMTIPELAKTTWRMQMMSPERQKVSPYFLGGETIIVSFPTDDMAHADKLMSLRGNNRHFCRATVHHELIPGHHLQGFMTRRFRTHRRVFATPFWMEGWALYWEMLLWDLDFPQSPENRVGMLFWRMHRCARIVFSLSFHLELMTAEEAIDYLIENVGHERNNATAEVRRSVSGDYGPLYQAAYMLGGLQLRALHEELVGSGRMTDRAFHDGVLRQNSMPVEMVRAALTGQPLDREFQSSWRFSGDPAEGGSFRPGGR